MDILNRFRELDDVKGIGVGTLKRIKETLNAELMAATFSARAPGDASASTGWSETTTGLGTPSEGRTNGDDIPAKTWQRIGARLKLFDAIWPHL